MKQLGNGARAKKIWARFSFAEGICGPKVEKRAHTQDLTGKGRS